MANCALERCKIWFFLDVLGKMIQATLKTALSKEEDEGESLSSKSELTADVST